MKWIEINGILLLHLLYLLELHCVHSIALQPISHLLLFTACQKSGHCDDGVDAENKSFFFLSWQNAAPKTKM